MPQSSKAADADETDGNRTDCFCATLLMETLFVCGVRGDLFS